MNQYSTPTREVKLKYCAFLDLLGLRAKLANFEEALSFYFDAAEFTLRYWPDQFLELNRMFQQPGFEHMDDSNDPSFSYSIISDSFIVSSEKPTWTVPTAFQVAHFAIQRGVALRGAISFGKHYEQIDSTHHFILSEAYTQAYLLESTVAKTPRVILDPHQLEKFQELFVPKSENSISAVQCEDNLWCLNILPFDYDYSVLGNIVQSICQPLSSPIIDKQIKQKWSWLGDYYNALVWGRDNIYESNCDPSFREYLQHKASDFPQGIIAPMWLYKEYQENKFYFMRKRQHNQQGHDFSRGFHENYSNQLDA